MSPLPVSSGDPHLTEFHSLVKFPSERVCLASEVNRNKHFAFKYPPKTCVDGTSMFVFHSL